MLSTIAPVASSPFVPHTAMSPAPIITDAPASAISCGGEPGGTGVGFSSPEQERRATNPAQATTLSSFTERIGTLITATERREASALEARGSRSQRREVSARRLTQAVACTRKAAGKVLSSDLTPRALRLTPPARSVAVISPELVVASCQNAKPKLVTIRRPFRLVKSTVRFVPGFR